MLSAPDFREKQILFVMVSREDKLSFKNDNIILKTDNEIRHQSSCYRLFAVFLVGHTTITTGLIQRAKKFGFSLLLLTHNLSPYASVNARAEGNVLLRAKQYHYHKLDIARHLVCNKIENQIAGLKKIRDHDDKRKEAIRQLTDYQTRASESVDLQGILGIEGIASRVYFQRLFAPCNWKGRSPRTKKDPLNTLLDIGYTMLFNMIDALLNLYGFDVYKGVYHQEFYQRKSLVCDLMEVFRVMIDYRIRNAFQLGQVNQKDFIHRQGQYFLFGKAAKPYCTWLLQEILAHKEDLFAYVQSYYRSFMRDKEITEYPIYGYGNDHVNSRI